MLEGLKILALIPARAGSKGIKNKNIVDLAGKPLIAYSIEAAKESRYIDKIVVSTDGVKIAETAKRYGASVPFLRPEEFAQDTSKTIDAVLHCVDTLEQMGEHYDVLCLLQPTEPMRTTEDIDCAIEKFVENGKVGLASISEVDDHPILIRSVDENGRMKSLLHVNSTCRRQDMPQYYRINGAIYINLVTELSPETSFNDNPIPYIMDKRHSIDIDEMDDLMRAELYVREQDNSNIPEKNKR